MALKIYELRDPGQLISDVVDRHAIRPGDVVAALVNRPSTDQDIVEIVPLATPRWREADQYERPNLLADIVDRMAVPASRMGKAPTHSIVTIVAREGFAVIGPDEAVWLNAWHFANHLAAVFTADLMVLTPYGWTDFMSGWGGCAPCLCRRGSPSTTEEP